MYLEYLEYFGTFRGRGELGHTKSLVPPNFQYYCVYSVDIGPVHLISFNSEFYYFVQYGWEQIIQQYKWLERDLIVSYCFHFIIHKNVYLFVDVEFRQ